MNKNLTIKSCERNSQCKTRELSTLKNHKTIHYKSIWNHKIMMAIRRFLEKISCNEATSSDDANSSNTVYRIFSLFLKTAIVSGLRAGMVK